MPYIVNQTHDALRVPSLSGRVLQPGASSKDVGVELTADEAAEFALNVSLAAFQDDGTPIEAPVPDWSPKKIDLSWMSPPEPAPEVQAEVPQVPPAAQIPSQAPTTQVEVSVPAGEHVEIVPDATNGAQQ